jgi:hypothetical protein
VFDIYSDTQNSALHEIPTPKSFSQKSIFMGVVIPKTSFSDSQATLLSETSQTPLQSISGNIQHSNKILSMLRKPDMKVSFKIGKKWEAKQPNDHTSTLSFISSLFLNQYLC